MSYVTHQYSRVDFYSSLEVNLSLYYGGVLFKCSVPELNSNDCSRIVGLIEINIAC